MPEIIYDYAELFRRQVAERSLFNLDLFDRERAVFPRPVFKKSFSVYLFMVFNDWFADVADYNCLINFLNATGEKVFYASCPHYFMVNPVKFTNKTKHDEFQKGIRHHIAGARPNVANEIGILVSGQTFYYGESERWAMVLDISNNLVIVGLDATTVVAFERAFEGKFFDVQGVIDWFIKGFEQFYQLSPESFHDVTDEEDTPTQIRRNYEN